MDNKIEIKNTRNYLKKFYKNYEISEYCNVGVSTINSFLNDSKKINKDTEEHILERLKEMKKHANKKLGVIQND